MVIVSEGSTRFSGGFAVGASSSSESREPYLHIVCRGGSAGRQGRGLILGGGGGCEWGWGWTVELKLNRKKRKNWIPTGGCDPPNPLDPTLVWRVYHVCVFVYITGADLGILRGEGASGPEFFEGGGVRVQVHGNFHILTRKEKPLRGEG